jgi:hypothetical protein
VSRSGRPSARSKRQAAKRNLVGPHAFFAQISAAGGLPKEAIEELKGRPANPRVDAADDVMAALTATIRYRSGARGFEFTEADEDHMLAWMLSVTNSIKESVPRSKWCAHLQAAAPAVVEIPSLAIPNASFWRCIECVREAGDRPLKMNLWPNECDLCGAVTETFTGIIARLPGCSVELHLCDECASFGQPADTSVLGDALAAYESANEGEIVLKLEFGGQTLVRRIPRASPLRADVGVGMAAEHATHDAAARWGLPDFLFKPVIQRRGSASREISDGVLLLASVGVVVQIKSRERASADEERERGWTQKHIDEALKQANGTIRNLKRVKTTMTNARGRQIDLDGNDYRWLEVVVLDHPNVPKQIVPDASIAKYPAVVLTRRDWEFLFNQLKSTHAVVDYFERVAGEMVDLDSESVRYTDLALADLHAPSAAANFELLGPGARPLDAPLLPLQPAAADDLEAHLVVRMIFEDIARTPLAETFNEHARLRTLADLDSLPVGHRAELGRLLLSGLREVAETPEDTTEWRIRRIVSSRPSSERSTQLAFGVCSELTDMHRDLFGTLVEFRHYELFEQMPVEDQSQLTTIGVLLTNRTDDKREWDTTMFAVTGDLDLSEEDLAMCRDLWSQNHDATSAASLR